MALQGPIPINNWLAEGPGRAAQTGADLQERGWSG